MAATSGDVSRFKDARRFASWFGLTPKCALANKLARICYATLRDKEKFDAAQSLDKKLNRQAFVMPA